MGGQREVSPVCEFKYKYADQTRNRERKKKEKTSPAVQHHRRLNVQTIEYFGFTERYFSCGAESTLLLEITTTRYVIRSFF